jgi:hypothetical protein
VLAIISSHSDNLSLALRRLVQFFDKYVKNAG